MSRAFLLFTLAAALAAQSTVPIQPPHESGQSVTGAFEGWYANPDGTFTILLGYYNRNTAEEPDIPIGSLNRIEPGGPDRGQPTHFLTGRQWGVFTIQVPKDFGKQKLTWTLVANGVSTVIPASLDPLWEIAPFEDANGNHPPYVGFSDKGPFANGPAGLSKTMDAAAGAPLELSVWAADDASLITGAAQPRTPPVTLRWSKFRGPGNVKFSNDAPEIQAAPVAAPGKTLFQGKATTTATFSAPGEYVLRLVANDWSGDGGRGFQCCWSNAQVKITVHR